MDLKGGGVSTSVKIWMNGVVRTLRLEKTLVHEVLAIPYPGWSWGELTGPSKLMHFRPEKGNRWQDFLLASLFTLNSLPPHLPTCFQPRKNLNLPRSVLTNCSLLGPRIPLHFLYSDWNTLLRIQYPMEGSSLKMKDQAQAFWVLVCENRERAQDLYTLSWREELWIRNWR